MEQNEAISIRPLTGDDLEDFKSIRLRALKDNPGVFSHPYERAIKQNSAYWEDILSRDEKEVFGLFHDHTLIGITGVFTVQEDPSGKTAIFGMSYIEPHYRGRNLSDMLYKARISWARNQRTFDKILVSHRAGNEASRKSMIKHGFQYIEDEMTDWPDGMRECECKYELILNDNEKKSS